MISIIIPVYNVKNYLTECLESLKLQDQALFEIILIDDGSTDGSQMICDSYKSEFCNISVIHKKNSGLSDTRNVGIRKAKGDYVLFLDSDDVLVEGSIKEINDCLNKKPDILVTELVEFYDELPEIKKTPLFTPPQSDKDSVFKFVFRNKAHTWTAQQYIVSRDYLMKNGIEFDYGYYHEDVSWTARIFIKANEFAYYPYCWYLKRGNRSGSIMNTVNPKRSFDIIELARQNQELCKLTELSDIQKSILLAQLSRAAYSGVSKYKYYDNDTRKRLVEYIEKNKSVFRYEKSARYMGFNLILRIFGAKAAINAIRIWSQINEKKNSSKN